MGFGGGERDRSSNEGEGGAEARRGTGRSIDARAPAAWIPSRSWRTATRRPPRRRPGEATPPRHRGAARRGPPRSSDSFLSRWLFGGGGERKTPSARSRGARSKTTTRVRARDHARRDSSGAKRCGCVATDSRRARVSAGGGDALSGAARPIAVGRQRDAGEQLASRRAFGDYKKSGLLADNSRPVGIALRAGHNATRAHRSHAAALLRSRHRSSSPPPSPACPPSRRRPRPRASPSRLDPSRRRRGGRDSRIIKRRRSRVTPPEDPPSPSPSSSSARAATSRPRAAAAASPAAASSSRGPRTTTPRSSR